MDIIITPMTTSTAESVAQIEKKCFTQPWSADAFMKELDNPNSITLVAVNENVVGFINAHKIFDEVYINNIAVLKEFRRNHIAEKLLNSLEENIKSSSSFITLEVRESNHPAQNLYSKLGYKIVGERKHFYSEPTENAILMTKNL